MDFGKLAEKRIEAAIEAGEMDNLPLAGQALPVDQAEGDPMEVAGFQMMARAGALPMEIQLKKEIAKEWQNYRACNGEEHKRKIMSIIADLEMRLAMMLEGRR